MKKAKAYKPKEINISNFSQVRNYALSFKVTVEDLKKAVSEIGPRVDDLITYFKSYQNPYLNRTKGWRL